MFLILFFCKGEETSFLVEDIKGRVIDLKATGKNLLIICFHHYNCIECFRIVDLLKSKYKKYSFAFLIRASKNDYPIKQKMIYDLKNSIKKFYKGNFNIYFDMHFKEDPWPPVNLNDGLFGKYKISKTPAYFILTKDTLIFVPFEQIEKELYK